MKIRDGCWRSSSVPIRLSSPDIGGGDQLDKPMVVAWGTNGRSNGRKFMRVSGAHLPRPLYPRKRIRPRLKIDAARSPDRCLLVYSWVDEGRPPSVYRARGALDSAPTVGVIRYLPSAD